MPEIWNSGIISSRKSGILELFTSWFAAANNSRIPDLRGLIFPEFQFFEITKIPDYALWNHIPDSTIRNFGIIISCFLD